MPPKVSKASDSPKTAAPLFLITGDDDFAVKGRAKQLYDQLCQDSGGFDNEVIDAAASNSGAALAAIGKLREAMQTIPFFGGKKVIWFQNCNFLRRRARGFEPGGDGSARGIGGGIEGIQMGRGEHDHHFTQGR